MSERLVSAVLKTGPVSPTPLAYIFGKYDYSDQDLAAISAVYDASLVDLDRATEELIAELDRPWILDDTVIVRTSDHGENLGDQHLFDQKYSLDDTLIRVPMVIGYPRLSIRLDHPTTASAAPENLAKVGLAKRSQGAESGGAPAGRPSMSRAVEVGMARSEKP